jgi:hypothetical protein
MPERKSTSTKKADRAYVDAGKDWETDQIGKRKVDPSVKRQIDKADGTLPNSVGQPAVKGADEGDVFKKAHERIAELRDSKKGVQDF